MHNVVAGILIAIPGFTLLAVPMCVALYRDYCSQEMPNDFGPAAAPIRRQNVSDSNEREPLIGGSQQRQFVPFQGSGHRLGAD